MERKLGTLFLTHSGRDTDLSLCSVNYLTSRYKDPDRLKHIPPLDSLEPTSKFDSYEGVLSIYQVGFDDGEFCVELAAVIKDDRKMQHVVQKSANELLVGFESLLEVWEFSKPIAEMGKGVAATHRCKARYEHGLFAGVHTVMIGPDGTAQVSCSAPDAVIEFDMDTGSLVAFKRMPEEIYGRNYSVDEASDMRAHYIHNDLQTTHVNAAWPEPDGSVLVSALIQGAIGVFSPEDNGYREIARGFVGCHGVRRSSEGVIYFADSAVGCLVFIDDEGNILRRYCVDSGWLHDVQQIQEDIYALGLSDRNELLICDISKDAVLYRKRYPTIKDSRFNSLRNALPWWRGNSTQFLSFQPAD